MESDIKEFSYPEKLLTFHGDTQIDSVVTSVITQFITRAQMGKEKYGVDLDRTDLTLLEWIEHAKQEHMDAILYLEKIKKIVSGEEKIY